MTKPKGSTLGAIAVCIAYAIGVVMGIASIYFYFQCIDCSQTRLFLNHWRFYVGGNAIMIVFALYAWFDVRK